jgi:hypothetical protein
MPASSNTGWTGYRVALELAAPLHIGWRTVGNLKQTRPYVTGTAIWGALVARLARDHMQQDYRRAEQWVKDFLRFTYLYPSSASDSVKLWPWAGQQSQFEWEHLNSYTSAALREGRMHEPGMLHEIEHLTARTRSGKPVFLLGYCWARPEFTADLKTLWGSAQFGGERSYGFGRIRQVILAEMTAEDLVFETYRAVPGNEVVLLPDGEHTLLAHVVHVKAESPESFSRSRVEPLVGRRIGKRREKEKSDDESSRAEALIGRRMEPVGRFNLSTSLAAYAPGTVCKMSSAWRIGEWGLWNELDCRL